MFAQVLASWGTKTFAVQLKQVIKSLAVHDKLPLQQCCRHSGVIDKDSIEAIILSSQETESALQIKTGIFFCEILSGCACSDDPSPAQTLENGYCEFAVIVDKQTADSMFTIP